MSISTGADIVNGPGQETDGADVFLDHLMNWGKDDSKGPSKPEKDQDHPEADEADTEEETVESTDESQPEADESPSEGGDDSEEEEQEQRVYVDDDEAYAKVKVGDDEYEVPLRDLKRLYGQETSITKKGQELATQRTALEEEQRVP
jgi:hypothetical protein